MIMRSKAYLSFELFMIAAVIGLNVAFLNNYATETILLKSIASLFFVLAGFCGYIRYKDNRAFSRLILIGVICCMAGDIFLALDSDGILFVCGVISFAIAHILFSVAFCKISPVKKVDIITAIVVLIGFLLFLCFFDFDFKGLFPVVILYAAIIAFMAIKALSLWPYRKYNVSGIGLLMLGGVLFLVSDLVLLFWLFGIDPAKEVQSLNWVLYYSSQLCTTAALNRYMNTFSISQT